MSTAIDAAGATTAAVDATRVFVMYVMAGVHRAAALRLAIPEQLPLATPVFARLFLVWTFPVRLFTVRPSPMQS